MTLTLEELSTGSTETKTSGSDDSDSDLRELCEELGANYDHVKEYIDENGNKSDVVDYARRLRDDEEHAQIMADYRRMNCGNRINLNHLRNDDQDFSRYTSEFYGDSDDPSEGTYNFVQQRAREADGNLFWYQALFPEPREEFWPSEPVLWQKFDTIGYGDDADQDTHIFVTRDFVEEYSDFAITVNGEEKPRPPSNEEIDAGYTDNSGSNAGGGSADLILDPGHHTVRSLREEISEAEDSGASQEQFEAVLEAEKAGKDRKTAKQKIEAAVERAEEGEQQDLEGAATAGEINGQSGVDVEPDKVLKLLNEGFTKDEIVAMFG